MAVFLDPGHNAVSDASITRQVPNGRGGTKECNTGGTATNDGYAEHTFSWDVTLRIRDALNQMGDLAGARAALERAVQVNPTDAKAYHLMGRVLDRMSLPEQAQEVYRRCRELTGL